MKAKKIIPVLLATMTLAMTGCGTSSEPEVMEYEVGVNTVINEEMAEFIEAVRPNAPIYANYLVETSALPTALGLTYEANGMSVSMDTYTYSLDKVAVSTVTDGVANDVILNDGVYYIVSDAEKTVLYMELTEEQKAMMTEMMTATAKGAFNPATAVYESGTTEYNGAEYLYEKITTEEIGEIMVYADTKTQDVKYIQSAGQIMEITFLKHEIDESVFEIPSDYTKTDMSTIMSSTPQ